MARIIFYLFLFTNQHHLIKGTKITFNMSTSGAKSVLMAFMILLFGMGCAKQMPEPKSQPEQKWIVSTVAGDGTASFTNGPGASANFHFPFDVVVNAEGVIYVTDVQNHCIRRIADGVVSTFAGGAFGIQNGSGLSAQFKYPFSITMDAAGNIYTTDVSDSRIRKINTAAEVSTYAGSGEEGFADGDVDSARFGEEASIVADALGNVYVADPQNNRIRKITISGKVFTIAGSGAEGFREGIGKMAQFNFPDGIALDKMGNIYVADAGNYRIRKITSEGLVTTYAGSDKSGFVDGMAGAARFNYPTDIVADSLGNLYVLDVDRIRKIAPDGVVSTIAGNGNGFMDGVGGIAKFFTPAGIGIDVRGNIYVADTDNNRIRKLSLE